MPALPPVIRQLQQQGALKMSFVRTVDLTPAERDQPPHRQKLGWQISACHLSPEARNRLISNLMTACDRQTAIRWLGWLSRAVRATRDDAADWDSVFRVFVDLMCPGYPRIAVEMALTRWAETERFWPAWVDLKAILDRETGALRSICQRLNDWQGGAG